MDATLPPMQITRPCFDEAEIDGVKRCLESGWVTQGPQVAAFERLVADRHRVNHALATTSCTAALQLAALALGLKPGDEVVVPAFTWVTSAHCVEYTGARAVFADIDLATYNVDPAALEAAITPRTRAVVAVHLFGLAAPMEDIQTIAKRHNLSIIEDAACAIGTTCSGIPVGGLGDVGCFSFHPRKVITTGEGGMVTTHREDISARIRTLRNHGASASADANQPWSMNRFDDLGYNLRLSDIQAAIGIAQMAKLDRLLAERRALALRYNEFLFANPEFALPIAGDVVGHTYQSYVIRVREGGRERRNAIMAKLQMHGIQTRPGTHAVHRLGYYREKYGLKPEDFPNATTSEDTTITLPIFPGMTEANQMMVCASLNAIKLSQ